MQDINAHVLLFRATQSSLTRSSPSRLLSIGVCYADGKSSSTQSKNKRREQKQKHFGNLQLLGDIQGQIVNIASSGHQNESSVSNPFWATWCFSFFHTPWLRQGFPSSASNRKIFSWVIDARKSNSPQSQHVSWMSRAACQNFLLRQVCSWVVWEWARWSSSSFIVVRVEILHLGLRG